MPSASTERVRRTATRRSWRNSSSMSSIVPGRFASIVSARLASTRRKPDRAGSFGVERHRGRARASLEGPAAPRSPRTVARSPSWASIPRDRSRVAIRSRSSSCPAIAVQLEVPPAESSTVDLDVLVELGDHRGLAPPVSPVSSAGAGGDAELREQRPLLRDLGQPACGTVRAGGPMATSARWHPRGEPAARRESSRRTSATSGSRWCSRRSPAANSLPSKVSSTTRCDRPRALHLEPGVLQRVDDRSAGRSGWVKVVAIVVGLRNVSGRLRRWSPWRQPAP